MSPVARDLGTPRFWRSYVLHALAALGAIAGALGLYDVLKPGAVAQSDFPFALVSGGVAIAYGTYMGWPRPIRQSYPVANTEIRLVEGDLFDQDVNLVIGMSNTFDTEIPHIISADSVQGQFLDRIYRGDRSALDEDLGNALAGTASSDGNIEKPGKTKLYDVGTIASIRKHRRFFFCVAYTKMNEANEARGTVEGLWRSLDNLWSEVREPMERSPGRFER